MVVDRRYIPRGALADFVQCFWYFEGVPKAHARERLLPNGECAVIINLRDEAIRIYDLDDLSRPETLGTAIFSGPRASCFAIDTNQQERVIGIQFRAGGAFPFLAMPASELEGISVCLEDVWRGFANEMREHLLEANSVTQMYSVLERTLCWLLRPAREGHPAIDYAINKLQIDRVGDVREEVGLSSRRFIELFRRQVGLTPKVFSRVRRFQKVLQTVHDRCKVDWADVALDCGYYDQAHLIHEFQAISGLRPGDYLAVATEHLNHVPLP